MADKFMGIIGWIALIVIVLATVFFIVEPIIWSQNYAEWVFYTRAFLLLFLISTFAQLRLFNAIVKNSLFLIKLRDAVYKSSNDTLRKSIDAQNEATEKLTDKIERIKFNSKSKDA